MEAVSVRLGRECRLARERAGLRAIDLTTTAGVSEAVLSRFERGVRWPRDFERIVSAYEHECGLPAGELWRRAVKP